MTSPLYISKNNEPKKKEKVKTLAISLALGDICSKGGTGIINQPLDGGVRRFEAVTAGLPINEQTLVVCTAGFSKREPRKPQPEREISLAEQLQQYVFLNHNEWSSHLVARPLCWSTRNEVRVGIKLAQRIGFADKHERTVVVISSNLSHLFRIKMYALLYTPRNWKIRLVRANHYFSLFSHILEIPKILRDVLYILRVLNRVRRLQKAH